MSDDAAPCSSVRLGRPVPAEWIGLDWYVATTLISEAPVRAPTTEEDIERIGGACWHERRDDGREVECCIGRDYVARRLLEENDWPCFLLEERTTGRMRGNGRGRGRRGMYDRNYLPGYVFVGGRNTMAAICAQIVSWRRQGRRHPLAGFIDHEGAPQRVSGADMQALFLAHEIGQHVPRNEREAMQRRIAIGALVQMRDGPFAFVPSIVDEYLTGKGVRIVEQLSGNEIPITTTLDKLEAIGV